MSQILKAIIVAHCLHRSRSALVSRGKSQTNQLRQHGEKRSHSQSAPSAASSTKAEAPRACQINEAPTSIQIAFIVISAPKNLSFAPIA
jgi:hypothetical protein